MVVNSVITTCSKNAVHLNCRVHAHMSSNVFSVLPQKQSSVCCLYSRNSAAKYGFSFSKTLSNSTYGSQKFGGRCFAVNGISNSVRGLPSRQLEISIMCQGMNMKLVVPKRGMVPKIKVNMGSISWPERCATAGLIFGLVCYSSFDSAHAEAAYQKEDNKANSDSSDAQFSHGKKVYTDYSVIGIPGDGRCLFRSLAHGACLRSGKRAPSESLQRQLADDLRASVADEFIKRRKETEWFIEGDFDTYVSQMRRPHVWGGEPELLMASHVLQMPITVYMHNKEAGGLISIAEYGQEYDKENPIRVLYHGFGHYDALQIP